MTKVESMSEAADTWLPTRRTLLSRLRDWNDRDGWQQFFNTYWKLIYSVARRSGLAEAEAQEVVQETLITVSKQMPGFKYDRSKGSFKNWLEKTTRWKIQDRFRKRQRERRFGSGMEEPPDVEEIAELDDENSFTELWRKEWEQNLLSAAFERVKALIEPKEFQVFDFVTLKERPAGEVAKNLNLFRSQVYYLNHKVSRLVRREIEALRSEIGER